MTDALTGLSCVTAETWAKDFAARERELRIEQTSSAPLKQIRPQGLRHKSGLQPICDRRHIVELSVRAFRDFPALDALRSKLFSS